MNDTLRTRLYEPGWKYVPAAATDISKTFARIKRQQREQPSKAAATVTPIKRSAK